MYTNYSASEYFGSQRKSSTFLLLLISYHLKTPPQNKPRRSVTAYKRSMMRPLGSNAGNMNATLRNSPPSALRMRPCALISMCMCTYLICIQNSISVMRTCNARTFEPTYSTNMAASFKPKHSAYIRLHVLFPEKSTNIALSRHAYSAITFTLYVSEIGPVRLCEIVLIAKYLAAPTSEVEICNSQTQKGGGVTMQPVLFSQLIM